MTLNYNSISIAELDFETIKDTLKDFLRGQTLYTDFDFEGSGMNILLDVLAQHSSITAFTASMLGNEAYIDSAQLRQSVVSLAKQIGYTPRSVGSAKAVINISVPNVTGTPSFLSLPAGTRFSSPDGSLFTTIHDHKLFPSGVSGVYEVSDVDIYEGSLVSFKYIVDTSDSDQKFIINSQLADTTTLIVSISPSITSTDNVEYSLSKNITVLDSTSEIYFLQENLDGLFEVYFGNGVIGKNLENENVVNLKYVVATKTDGTTNNISSFQAREPIDGYGVYTITTVTSSYGGSPKETTDDIRHISPKMYQTQNRAVIKEDYISFLLSEYPWIDSLNVWGGEDNVPPQYGKIFISVKPVHADVLSDTLEDSIKLNLIKNYNVVTVIPEFVDPTYVFVNLVITVNYRASRTLLSEYELNNLVQDNLTNYFNNTIKKFNNPFYLSPLNSSIDAIDNSIVSSLTDVLIQLRFLPTANLTSTTNISFNNAIEPGSIISTVYNPSGTTINDSASPQYIVDDGEGGLLSKDVSNGITINNNLGVVNYATGEMSITMYPYELPADSLDIRVYAEPSIKNIIPGYNQIILPDDTIYDPILKRLPGVTINMINIEDEK